MKKWIVRILVAVLVIGAFAAVGFVGYRVGFSHGAQFAGDFESGPRFAQPFQRCDAPEFAFNPHQRGGPDREFKMTHRGRGFGFASPFFTLIKLALLGLIAWVAYMLFKGNGWTLSLTRVAAPQTPPATTPVDAPAPKRTGKGK